MKIKKFVSKLEKERDLMATVIYIYTEIFESPNYWGNVDNAMDLAKAFIVKYPTGTEWQGRKYTWEERMFEFVKKHHKLVKRKTDDLTLTVSGGAVQGIVRENGNTTPVVIRDYDNDETEIDEERGIYKDKDENIYQELTF